MLDTQELFALGIVALVAGRLVWRRWARRDGKVAGEARTGDCGDCPSSGPPPKEATVHFYRRPDAKGPANGAPGGET
ncbi:MAG: hypothetical protein ABL989_01645 [Gammaproteobacteria bacterium]